MNSSLACRLRRWVLSALSRKRLKFPIVNVVLILGASFVPARADVHFAEPIAEAGVVYAGAALAHEFIFENSGPQTVSILEVRATCGCLKPTLAQSSFRAGERGSVRLEVNTLSQAPGAHTWTVFVKYQTGNVSR